MNLECRVMNDFYPLNCYNKQEHILIQNTGIKSRGFNNIGNCYTFSIESPSVNKYGERQYLLNYYNKGEEQSETIEINTYSGLIGESMMRIIVSELFRRISNRKRITRHEFIKTNLNPFEDKRTILTNQEYSLIGISRYNQRIVLTNDPTKSSITEYDGLFEYETQRTRGIIICESKIGDLGYLKSEVLNEEKIKRKIIRPITSLFPDREIDYLLMGTKEEMQQKKKYSPLKPGIIKVQEYLNKHNIGLIPLTFPETKNRINQIATSILYLNKFKEIYENKIPTENKFLIDKNVIRIITGKRIDLILKKTSEHTYTVVYDSGKINNEEIKTKNK